MTWAVDHKLPTNLKMVLIMLANRTNHDTGRCDPSHKRLADDCGMSVSTVKRAIDKLEEMGLLTIELRKNGSVNLPNQYVLHLDRVGSHSTHPAQKEHTTGHGEPRGESTENRGGGSTVSYKPGSSKPGSKPGSKPIPPAEPSAAGELAAIEHEDKRPEFMDVEICGRSFSIPADMKYPKHGAKIHTEWAAYAICYHGVYKNWPTYNSVDAGLISNIMKVVPSDEFPAVIGAFLRSREQYVVARGHSLKVLAADPQKYITQARTGKSMTAARARQMDRQEANRSVVDDAMGLLFPGADAAQSTQDHGEVIDA